MFYFCHNKKSVTLIFISFLILLGFSNANAAVYRIHPDSDMVGQVVEVRSERHDTLLTIANQYGVGMHEILESNPHLRQTQETASQPLGRGKKVIVPTQYILPPYRKGIVINMPELRLYYFTPDGQYVYTYPVGLGRMEWRTPLAKTTVIGKETDPVWNVPPSIHAYVLQETGENLPKSVPPGPDNPLGHYALRLGTSGYLIHGTNQPWSIGKYVSSGCIRLHNEDIEQLYHQVKTGTPVRLVNFPSKAGWAQGKLYLQSRIPLDVNAPPSELNAASVHAVIQKAMLKKPGMIDWSKVAQVQSQSQGIPQLIGVSKNSHAYAQNTISIDKTRGILYNNHHYVAQKEPLTQEVPMVELYEEREYEQEINPVYETVAYQTTSDRVFIPHEVELN